MKTNKLLFLLLILAVSFSSYGQNPFTEMLNDPATRAIIDADVPTRDQVILDDLIVDGSACVGMDCVNGESFGFDTFRMKENNLRMHFEDTSSSASFPSADWRFVFNDSSNGGANYFAVEHSNTSRQIFKVEAGGPANSLYVDDGGRIGLGTATPVVEIHSKNGDSPTLRLEQDGSSGFTPQTWDVAGNETNFFIRDASNGSNLVFRIKAGAPKNSIFVDSDGDIGLGTESPDAKLELETGDLQVKAGDIRVLAGDVNVTEGSIAIGTPYSSTFGRLYVKQLSNDLDGGIGIEAPGTGGGFKGYISMAAKQLTLSAGQGQQNNVNINPTGTGFVGIGTNTPATRLDVNGVITTPGGNSDEWNAASLNMNNASREMTALQSQIDDLMTRIEAMESCGCYNEVSGDEGRSQVGDNANIATDRAYLSQNIPNPFDNTTNISYFVPFVNSSANIVISNATGQILENRSIDKFGQGSIIVSKARMSTGIYFYTLYVDGKKVDTKRMVVE